MSKELVVRTYSPTEIRLEGKPELGRIEAPTILGISGLYRGCGDVASYIDQGEYALWAVFEVDPSCVRDHWAKCVFVAGNCIYVGLRDGAIKILDERYPDLPIPFTTRVKGENAFSIAGYKGKAVSGRYGHSLTLNGGTSEAGDFGTAITGAYGIAKAGRCGRAFADEGGTAIVGERGVATAGHGGLASGGEGALLQFQRIVGTEVRYIGGVTGHMLAVSVTVGRDGIQPYTKYGEKDGVVYSVEEHPEKPSDYVLELCERFDQEKKRKPGVKKAKPRKAEPEGGEDVG